MKKLTVLASSYKVENYLKEYLKSAASQSFKEFEIAFESILPSSKEIKIFEKAKKKYSFINLNVHNKILPLPAAWNISIERTNSELICIWNVDDLRTQNSLQRMVEVFNKNSDIDFVYGDYIVVNKFKKTKGNYVNESNRENELKKSMIIGPFFMFRRNLLDRVGLFDEQLLSGADYDFAMRLGRKCKGKHLDYNLGFYLNTKTGLSTKPDSLQEIERTVVELRYGLEPINKSLTEKAESKYNISKYIIKNKSIDIKNYIN